MVCLKQQSQMTQTAYITMFLYYTTTQRSKCTFRQQKHDFQSVEKYSSKSTYISKRKPMNSIYWYPANLHSVVLSYALPFTQATTQGALRQQLSATFRKATVLNIPHNRHRGCSRPCHHHHIHHGRHNLHDHGHRRTHGHHQQISHPEELPHSP